MDDFFFEIHVILILPLYIKEPESIISINLLEDTILQNCLTIKPFTDKDSTR